LEALTVFAKADISCLLDTQAFARKNEVIAECLRELLDSSSFRLERIIFPDSSSASQTKIVALFSLVAKTSHETALNEFEDIVNYINEETGWKFERPPLIQPI